MPLESATPLDVLAGRVERSFRERFGEKPECVVAAPGRVNLIGEHIDYNDGFVLPMAIDRYTVVAARRNDSAQARLTSATMGSEAQLSVRAAAPSESSPGWAKYAAGVFRAFEEVGIDLEGFDAVLDSSVPLGAGLSSSAALEVSLATAIEALFDRKIEPVQKGLLCQRAEHLAGMPCGVMDQFSSVLCVADHAMLLDCRDHSYQMRALDDPAVVVLISNTNVKHELTGGEYAERCRQCEVAAAALGVASLREASLDQLAAAQLDDPIAQRARHVISEIERTTRAAETFALRDWTAAGALMDASHRSLRDDYAVSCAELDAMVDAHHALGPAHGVFGARMTGGGFGGSTVAIVSAELAHEAAERIAEKYRQATGLEATQFVSRPSRGAHRVA